MFREFVCSRACKITPIPVCRDDPMTYDHARFWLRRDDDDDDESWRFPTKLTRWHSPSWALTTMLPIIYKLWSLATLQHVAHMCHLICECSEAATSFCFTRETHGHKNKCAFTALPGNVQYHLSHEISFRRTIEYVWKWFSYNKELLH